MSNKFDLTGKTPSSLSLSALSIIGAMQDIDKVDVWTLIALGHYDDLLPFAFFHIVHNKFPETQEEVLACTKCREGADRVKAQAKFNIQYIMRKADEQEQQENTRKQKQQAAQVSANFKAQHAPAPEGTVKELAAKYGKSLSEIRRLKNEGLLHTLAE